MYMILFIVLVTLIPITSYSEEILMTCSGITYQLHQGLGQGVVEKADVNTVLIDTTNKTIKTRVYDGTVRSMEYTENDLYRICYYTGKKHQVTQEFSINKLTDTISVAILHNNIKHYAFLGGCTPRTSNQY